MSDSCCERLRALLSREPDVFDAPGDIDREVAAHIAACPHCRDEEAGLSALLDRYRHAEAEALDDDLAARLLDRVCAHLHPGDPGS